MSSGDGGSRAEAGAGAQSADRPAGNACEYTVYIARGVPLTGGRSATIMVTHYRRHVAVP